MTVQRRLMAEELLAMRAKLECGEVGTLTWDACDKCVYGAPDNVFCVCDDGPSGSLRIIDNQVVCVSFERRKDHG
jgi:hypothetical protein